MDGFAFVRQPEGLVAAGDILAAPLVGAVISDSERSPFHEGGLGDFVWARCVSATAFVRQPTSERGVSNGAGISL